MTSRKLRRPHVVPAGYQRNFADGQQIRVIERTSGIERVVGVKDNFVVSHFLRTIVDGVANDAAEDEFARIEDFALPLIRTIQVGVPMTEDQHLALKGTMAMLWARSLSREVVAQRIHDELRATYPAKAARMERAISGFRRERGREPDPGEIEAIVQQAADDLRAERVQDVSAMLRHHNEAVQRFLPLHVSLYGAPPGTEFITSDNPVLLAHTNQMIVVGTHNGLALGDASFIFLPIGRHVGACLTRDQEGDLMLDRRTVALINHGTWRNAVARVACHPSLAAWRRHCNLKPLG